MQVVEEKKLSFFHFDAEKKLQNQRKNLLANS